MARAPITTAALWQQVLGAAVSLRRLGLGRGDVIGVQLPTWHEYLAMHIAANAVGATTMPISPIFRQREVGRQVALAQARMLVVPAAYGQFDYLAMARGLQREYPCLRELLAVGGTVDAAAAAGALSWSTLVAQGQDANAEAEREALARGEFAPAPGEFMLLNFTSGTTGVPKGVMHTWQTLSAAVGAGIERMQLTADDVLLTAVTLGHAGGFLTGMFMPLLLGARVVYMDHWDAGVALGVIERERVSYGPMMPTFLFDLLRHERFGSTDLSSWRKARVSGGSISRATMASLQDRLPALKLLPGWGLSEGLFLTCGSPDDPAPRRSHTDGRALRGVELQIRDSLFTHPVGAGSVGEIVVRAPSLMLGYFGQPELTAAATTADGWMKTGDTGQLDDAGYLVMVGRSKDIIVRGGENVPAVEVEHLLMEHPKVVDAVVIGLPDERLGERVCAVIECRQGLEPIGFEEMREHLVQHELTRQFIPERLVLVPSLPRTALGKIRKHELKAQILAELTAPLPAGIAAANR